MPLKIKPKSVKRFPEIFILLLLLIFFFGDSREPALQFFKVLRYPAVLLAGAYAANLTLKSRRIRVQFLYLLPFLAVAGMALLFSPSPLDAFLKTVSYALLSFVMFQFVLPVIRNSDGRLLVQILYLFSGLLLLGLLLIPVAPSMVFLASRFRGLLGNPNGLGIFSVLFLFYQLLIFDRFLPKKKLLKWAAVGVVMSGVLLSGSRNSLMSTSVLLLVYYAFHEHGLRRIIIFGLILPAVIATVTIVPLDEVARLIGAEEHLRVENIEEGSGRKWAWQYALEKVAEAPVLGRGFYYDEYIFQTGNIPSSTYLGGHQGGVHNSYIGFLLNTGWSGLALITFYFGMIFKRLPPNRYLFALIASVPISITFEAWLMSSLNAFTIFFFLNIVILYALKGDFILRQSVQGRGGLRMANRLPSSTP